MTRTPRVCLRSVAALVLACAIIVPGAVAAYDVRDAAQRWLAGYDKALAAIVATETYAQEVRRKELHDGAASGTSRIVSSEFAWVPVLGDRDVVGVRAVRAVDHRTVGASGRLEALLDARAPDREAQVQALLAESVRYLEVPGAVNFNFPTFALAYLRPDNAERAKWSVHDGPTAGTAEIRFREKDRTLVRTREGQPIRAEGSFIVERATGRVRQSRVVLNDARVLGGDSPMMESVHYEATVHYTEEPRLGMAVPARMDDRYEWRVRPSEHREDVAYLVIDGRATYTDYRRFQTEARIVP